MKLYGIGLSLASIILALALVPALASAQQGSGWIGVAYDAPAENDWSRVRVLRIHPGSPAERAGLREGDVIVRVNGRVPRTADEFRTRLAPGDRVRFRVERDGRARNVRLTAAERPGRVASSRPARMLGDTTVIIDGARIRATVGAALDSVRMHLDTLRLPTVTMEREGDASVLRIDGPDGERRAVLRIEEGARGASIQLPARGDRPARRGAPLTISALQRGVAGAEVRELNPGLASYFGVEAGVVALDVPEGTPAARSGLRSGDVIVRAGGRDVSDVDGLRRAISEADDRRVPLTIVREQRRHALTLRWE